MHFTRLTGCICRRRWVREGPTFLSGVRRRVVFQQGGFGRCSPLPTVPAVLPWQKKAMIIESMIVLDPDKTRNKGTFAKNLPFTKPPLRTPGPATEPRDGPTWNFHEKYWKKYPRAEILEPQENTDAVGRVSAQHNLLKRRTEKNRKIQN